MPRTRENTAYAQRLIREYNHARKILHKYLKKRHEPNDVTDMIAAVIEGMTAKQSKIIGYTLNKSFKAGAKEGDKEISTATISAAASVGFDLSKVSDSHLNKIAKDTIGSIGKYNTLLSKQLTLQYDTLLADNRLVTSLTKDGWTPWLDKSLRKRGVSPEVIALAKGQTTTKKIVDILELEGIRGGKNPRQVSKMLIPHVQRYFGPGGVLIDHVGNYRKALEVNANGEHKWVQKKITRVFRATPKNYADIIARSSMLDSHREGRFQTLQKSGLVDHYISISVLDAATCNLCAGLSGQRISKSEGPSYHPRCRCSLKPIFKKDSGIKNKPPEFYENQRDQHFWKQHQLAEYNKNMPRGAKLKFHSMLPKDAIATMPGKGAMRTIRYDALGKPGAIKPKVPVTKPRGVSKPQKIVVEDEMEIMKREERAHATELWKKTKRDNCEHMKITNSKILYVDGQKRSVNWDAPETPFKAQHTHPSWDSPLSGSDIANFLTIKNMTQTSASSSESIYLAKRTYKTGVRSLTARKGLIKKFQNTANDLNKDMVNAFRKKTGHYPTKEQALKLWHDANDETNKIFANFYKYEYISFSRKP